MYHSETTCYSHTSFAVRLYAQADASAHAVVSIIMALVYYLMPHWAPSTPPKTVLSSKREKKRSVKKTRGDKQSVRTDKPSGVANCFPTDSMQDAYAPGAGCGNKTPSRKFSFSSVSRRFSFSQRRSSISSGGIIPSASDVSDTVTSDETPSRDTLSRRSSFSSLKSTWSFHRPRRPSTSSTTLSPLSDKLIFSPPMLETILSVSIAPLPNIPSELVDGAKNAKSKDSVKRKIYSMKWMGKMKTLMTRRTRSA
ncbi:hypothetical protein BDN72DRAFT_98506 [Pluteus cervinus]|uniref:Uncharacterized protein n=1 Tax=Pluteus cervinus TaxID=181527 RepID=A0ACD3ANU9_9AGAR|nr:hypothetical protein BDN72DRAFT_98506 [Pluteus cervinus]